MRQRSCLGAISTPEGAGGRAETPVLESNSYVLRGKELTSEKDLSPIEQACAAKGMRMTEQRRVIAHVLGSSQDHPDVEELYRRAVAIDDKISISTVYRTVKLFEDAGIIERHDFREGRSRYEQVPDEHHDHLIDVNNGTVIEFRSEEIERLQDEIARRHGFKLVGHRLELYAVRIKDKSS
jgi:Fur family ferric uptake transcriptional regulator